MTSRVLVDTNVFVYAYDRSDARKQERALAIVGALESYGVGAVSTQVLAEYFDVVTRSIPDALTRETAASRVADLAAAWTVLTITPGVLAAAVESCSRRQWRIYDAQIWAAAKANDIPFVLSEDFEDGMQVDGVTFLDPFAEGFTLALLGLVDA